MQTDTMAAPGAASVTLAHSALFDMEALLLDISDASDVIMVLCDNVQEEHAKLIRLMCSVIEQRQRAAYALQTTAWRATHSRRAHFERVGWPGDEVAA